jgi:hypothetical protein
MMVCLKFSRRFRPVRATDPQSQICVFRRTARRRWIAVFPCPRSTAGSDLHRRPPEARHINQAKPMTATAVIQQQSPFAAPAHSGPPRPDRSTHRAAADRSASAPTPSDHIAAPGARRSASDATPATVRVIRTGRRPCVRRRGLDIGMIPTRNDMPDTFVRSISRGPIRYHIDPWMRDQPGMPPQHQAARPIATAPVIATPKHLPVLFERPMTADLVAKAASDDAKEVTP